MNKTQKIFGIYPVLEALKSKTEIDKLYLQKKFNNPKLTQIETQALKKGLTVQHVPIEKLNRLTKGNHQGTVAVISPISFKTIEQLVEETQKTTQNPLFLVLDQITDVRNFGAIIRTAECTGVNAIIIQRAGGAPVTGDTVKTSAGAVFKVPICKVGHIKDALYYLQGSGVQLVAATENTSTTVYGTDLRGPTAIIMGSEGKGISKSVLQVAGAKASLPLLGEINSLNVSVACGAFLYEAVRQRTTNLV
ncbi:MAG: 23S rRNA (guanosine(2251)-2'-O)-methyltransferase RlmB [Marinirhabdus sp.]